jgi:hypothetical protein
MTKLRLIGRVPQAVVYCRLRATMANAVVNNSLQIPAITNVVQQAHDGEYGLEHLHQHRGDQTRITPLATSSTR